MEHYGIKVCLVHPREVQQVKGRKSDVKDSQWIQRMYSAGLLRESILSGERDPQKLVLLCHEKILTQLVKFTPQKAEISSKTSIAKNVFG